MENYVSGITELSSLSEDSDCYVLDTNYLLGLSYSIKFSEQYLKAIIENKSKIFIPFIVWVEFNYNIQRVLEETEGLLEGAQNFLGSYKAEKLNISTDEMVKSFNNIFNSSIIKSNTVGQAISEDISKYFSEKINSDSDFKEIIGNLNEKKHEILNDWEKNFRTDLDKKIQGHLKKTEELLINLKKEVNSSETNIQIGEKYSKEKLKEKIKECELRAKNDLYPGNSQKDLSKGKYRIWGDLEIPSKYGDMLFWLEIIEFAKKHKDFKKVVIVSNDIKKDDWVSKKTKKLIPQLSIEFFTKTSGSTVEHMKVLDFVTKFSPGTSHEELQRDYRLQEDLLPISEGVDFETSDASYEDFEFEKDTIIVHGNRYTLTGPYFQKERGYVIHISPDRLPNLKYIAVYQDSPVCAVTHSARINVIEHVNGYRKQVVFVDGPARPLRKPIPKGVYDLTFPIYTNHIELDNAVTMDDLLDDDL